MIDVTEAQLDEVIENFGFEGELVNINSYGSGHINDTFLLTFSVLEIGNIDVILQRMNIDVFKRPVELMENIDAVTSYLKEKISAEGGDPKRETLNLIRAKDGNIYYKDSLGDFWRAFIFIACASSYDTVKDEKIFFESAITFGNFQALLSEFPAEKLHVTIEGFHDTEKRFKRFKDVLSKNPLKRAVTAKNEIDFVLEREDLARYSMELLRDKKLPLRVSHNDTKLNNIMIDNKSGKGICVIDLDTVMPGLSINDFGDAIRFGANTAEEDEKDLSKVQLDLRLYEVYLKGFIEGCNGRLTKLELENLPMGAMGMTFECGMRFLTDYLEGDKYFKIHREGHNLDRARTQFKLLSEMEKHKDEMYRILNKYI